MEYTLDFGGRIQCSAGERERCARMAARIVGLAERSRREGLLSLEEELEQPMPDLLRVAAQLVVDGADPGVVRAILETRIAVGDFRGAELLERCLILEGMLSVQAGDNPRLVELRLESLLGEDGAELLRGAAGAQERAPAANGGAPKAVPPEAPHSAAGVPPETEARIRQIADLLEKRLEAARAFQEEQIARSSRALQELLGAAGFPPPVSVGAQDVEVDAIRWLAGRSPEVLAALPSLLPGPVGELVLSRIVTFDALARLSDRELQKLLRHVDSSCLARALKGAPEVAAKAFRNMSTRAAALLKEDMDCMGPVALDTVLSDRHAILKIAWLLVAQGEIRPPPTGELLP